MGMSLYSAHNHAAVGIGPHSVCAKDQQDAHFISFICFSYTILYMFRKNKFNIRSLLVYTQHVRVRI